jgi:hypothetical protein
VYLKLEIYKSTDILTIKIGLKGQYLMKLMLGENIFQVLCEIISILIMAHGILFCKLWIARKKPFKINRRKQQIEGLIKFQQV